MSRCVRSLNRSENIVASECIPIETGGKRYHVNVGADLLNRQECWSDRVNGTGCVAVFTSQPVLGIFHDTVETIRESASRLIVIQVPDGEAAKSLEVMATSYETLASARFTRRDMIVGLGGGTVTDIAAFVASTWKRGTRLIHAPTTLLAQVDAAVGGKTAINLDGGRNLIGTFYQPEHVVADVVALATLSPREIRSGLAEVIKCGFVSDASILDLLDQPFATETFDASRLADVVSRSVRVKASLINEDETDEGPRRVLNYGHTLGQALEVATNYATLSHGEAVAIGMVYAARVSEIVTGVCGLVGQTRDALSAVGVPDRLDVAPEFDRLWDLMLQDKKLGGAGGEFVVCPQPGRAELIAAPSKQLAREAFGAVSE